MIDEVESKHLQLLISRAFHAIIGKKMFSLQLVQLQREECSWRGDYLVTIT